MKFLLAPGIRLMQSVRYPWKFAMTGAVSVAMYVFLGGVLFTTLLDDMHATREARDGLPRVEALLKVAQISQQHRGLSAGVLNGGAHLTPKLEERSRALVDAVGQLDQALGGMDASPALRQRWEGIKSAWSDLSRQGLSMAPAANLAAHTKLIENQIGLLHDLGDEAHLTLNSEADSHHLLAALLDPLPQMTERMGRLRAMGTGALAAQQMDDQRRMDLSAQLGQWDMAFKGFVESMDRAGRNSPPVQGAMAELKTNVERDAAQIREEISGRLLKGDLRMPPGAFFDMMTHAIDRAYDQAYGVIVPQVRGILASRLDGMQRFLVLQVALCAVGLAVLGYLSLAAYCVVVGSVSELRRGMEDMASGNLAARIEFSGRDELQDVATSLRKMAGTFHEVIQAVQASAAEVTAAASSLASGAAEVSQGSEQQSEAASSMAAAVEQMTVGVDEIARNAREAEEVSQQSGKLCETSTGVMQRAVGEIQRIAETVHSSAEVIQDLGKQSARISTMVSSIQEIADQTHLLALNAAIEAARAGESGRGFAVVADEVRKLAERTGQATREITGMVTAIQGGTERAVATMREGVTRVEQGVQLTTEAGDSMTQIRGGTDQVLHAVGDISLALREQSAASTDIARNVERIAHRAEANSQAVRDTAMTASRLESLARSLQGEVGRFRV